MQHILDNTKAYVDLAEKRGVYYADVEKALKMVRAFIVEHKLIIYGGMSIDLALKANGHKGIYSADIIPDYDFMSPDFYNHANHLANILANAGLPNVSSINAAHITTRRVRVNFIPVADITYIPPNIYENLPYLQVGDLRVIHPVYQRLDMHRAFNTPFEKPPLEVFLGRANKDQKRFRLLASNYPVVAEPAHLAPAKTVVVPAEYMHNTILGGFTAYMLYYDIYLSICQVLNLTPDPKVIPLHGKVENNITLAWDVNLPPKINLVTDNYANLSKKIAQATKATPKHYNKYLDDFRPETYCVDMYEIYNNSGKKTPCFNLMKILHFWQTINKGVKVTAPEYTKNIYLAQAQYVLLYFLLKSFEFPEQKNVYLGYYVSLEKMVETAEGLMSLTEWSKMYKNVPFFLSSTTYGTTNYSPDYINMVQDKLAMLAGTRLAGLRPIFGYYPDNGDQTWPEFNPSDSELFCIDGLVRKN